MEFITYLFSQLWFDLTYIGVIAVLLTICYIWNIMEL